MSDIASNAAEVRARIAAAAREAGRDPDEVRLVAVTKTFPVQVCIDAVTAGLVDLGENYAAELRDKAPRVPGAVWHYLGPLQSGTVRHVARHAQWVHSLAPGHAAERLSDHAARDDHRIPCLVQIDLAARGTGVPREDAAEAIDALAGLEGLDVRGLMTLPPPTPTAEQARPYFQALREMRDDLRKHHPQVSELSMGMSMDYEVAVQEGATMVRVGTALFGHREGRETR